ncbi:hypothetical protein ACH5RR_001711 [Cinchona calisaya]|uniref:Uncharacterized protein n=1 Tax=Cinchona calisaya TaxID=153742 RepID=A0ABD3B491_9GENT
MLTKPHSFSSSSATAPTTCGNCGVEEHRLLHNVRHHDIFFCLCTTCVVRLHAQSFRPTCFAVYHPYPPPPPPTTPLSVSSVIPLPTLTALEAPIFPTLTFALIVKTLIRRFSR